MSSMSLPAFAQMRLVIGYLGEKAQLGWWQSSFLSPAAEAFAAPVFPRTHLLARYHGVLEAARRVHDSHIGVGAAYHLFRLPESLEEQLSEFIRTNSDTDALLAAICDRTEAEATLQRLVSIMPSNTTVGPVRLGRIGDLSSTVAWQKAMGFYAAAVGQGIPLYPYFAD